MTKKGQVTVPAPVRQQLGLKPGQQARFTVNTQSGQVQISRKSTAGIAAFFGMLTATGQPEDSGRLRETFEREAPYRDRGAPKEGARNNS